MWPLWCCAPSRTSSDPFRARGTETAPPARPPTSSSAARANAEARRRVATSARHPASARREGTTRRPLPSHDDCDPRAPPEEPAPHDHECRRRAPEPAFDPRHRNRRAPDTHRSSDGRASDACRRGAQCDSHGEHLTASARTRRLRPPGHHFAIPPGRAWRALLERVRRFRPSTARGRAASPAASSTITFASVAR